MPDNQRPPQSPQDFIKTLSIIHLAMIAGLVVCCISVYFQTEQPHFDFKDTNDPWLYIVPLVAFAGFAASNLVFKQSLNKLVDKNSLKEKQPGYQLACIIRLAFLEGPSLLSAVVFKLTGNIFFLAITGLIILYFLMLRPTKERMADDLALSYEDKMELDSPETMK